MRVSRDAPFVLGLVLLIGLGTSAVRLRSGGTAQVPPQASWTLMPRIAVLDKAERQREIRDEKGRRYVFDDTSLSIDGIGLGMTEDEVRRLMGPEARRWAGTVRTDAEAILSWPHRGLEVSLTWRGGHAVGEVREVSGSSVESHGLVIGQPLESRDVVMARLANVTREGTSPEGRDHGGVRPGSRGERTVDTYHVTWTRLRVEGPDHLRFTLDTPRGAFVCGNAVSAYVDSTHPVDYANFMSLHGHPVESWTPFPGCTAELTRSRHDATWWKW